jgi:hypothetical protein
VSPSEYTGRSREALAAVDRIIGLDLSEVSVNGSLHNAPYGGEGTGPNPTADVERQRGGHGACSRRWVKVAKQKMPYAANPMPMMTTTKRPHVWVAKRRRAPSSPVASLGS